MRLHHLTAFAASLLFAAPGCVEQSPDTPSEDDIKAAKEHILSAPPASMKFTVNADLEGKITYLGMDVDTDTVTPGKPFTLTHYWKVNEPLTDWYVTSSSRATWTCRKPAARPTRPPPHQRFADSVSGGDWSDDDFGSLVTVPIAACS